MWIAELNWGMLEIGSYILSYSLLPVMTKSVLPELAKQGNIQAIASLLNYPLQNHDCGKDVVALITFLNRK
jgi:hypothetical protein